MLTLLQLMRFFCCIGFGESENCYGGTEEEPFAKIGKGSGAPSPNFTDLSILIVNVHKRMGNGANLISEYTSRVVVLEIVL